MATVRFLKKHLGTVEHIVFRIFEREPFVLSQEDHIEAIVRLPCMGLQPGWYKKKGSKTVVLSTLQS